MTSTAIVNHPESNLIKFLKNNQTPLSNASIWIGSAIHGICPIHCYCLQYHDLVKAITPVDYGDTHYKDNHLTPVIDSNFYPRYSALNKIHHVLSHTMVPQSDPDHQELKRNSQLNSELTGFLTILSAAIQLMNNKSETKRIRLGEYLVKIMKEYDVSQKLLSVALCRSYNQIGEWTWTYYRSLRKEDQPQWMRRFQ